MINQLILMLPSSGPSPSRLIQLAAILALVSLALWLVGARYSRQIITLCAVAFGTIVGKHLPEFFPAINLSAPVLAVGGALIFGVLGFVTHRFWVGLMLGGMLACWASLGTWTAMHGQQSWSQPVWDADMKLSQLGPDLWSVLPPDVTRILPWAAGGAMISGIALGILWPRVAASLNWSLTGATILLCAALPVVVEQRPQWLGALPAQPWQQAACFGGFVLLGAIVQWKFSSRGVVRRTARPAPMDA